MSVTEKIQGPALTDEKFFKECLDYEIEGLTETARYAANGEYDKAKKAFADYVRGSLKPDTFFTIPYEEPENAYYLQGETESDVCERVLKHVMVSCGIPLNFGKENAVDWMADPTGDTLKEWTWQLSRHHELKVLAHQYRKNPKREYAKAAAELFTSWVHQAVVPGEEVPGDKTECWRTIECGIRMGASWPYALHTFYQTPEFTDDVLVNWYKSVWEHGNRMQRNHWHGNWLIMEMNGLAQISILYPMFKKSKEWQDFAFRKLTEEIDRQLYPDGFQYELSTNYHDVVIGNYQRMINVAYTYGVPVLPKLLERLEKACEVYLQLMMPDGKAPNINDGTWKSVSEILESRADLCPDNREIAWAVSKGETGKKPSYFSVALPYSGFMAMRDGWEKDATWALFDGAPFGTGHQHEDKLSLLFYANGKLLLTEGGNYVYDTSKMREYVLSTRAHNTIRVDGADQNRMKNYCWKTEDITKKADLKWYIGERYDYAESTYDGGYGESADNSVVHNRRVYFIKNPENGLKSFLVVVDRMLAKDRKEHDYEMLWHIDSDLEMCSGAGCSFADINVCVSGECSSLQVVCGEEKPEWQGFVSTGFEQGCYREVNCIRAVKRGENLRTVTVLYPTVDSELRIVGVEAGENPEDTNLILRLSDGKEIELKETEAEK